MSPYSRLVVEETNFELKTYGANTKLQETKMDLRNIHRYLWGIFYLPHELAHCVVIWHWSKTLDLQLFPPQVNPIFKSNVPVYIIVLDALSPILIFGILWPVLTSVINFEFNSLPGIIIFIGYTFWMVPSTGDWEIALNAHQYKKIGYIPRDVPQTRTSSVLFILSIFVVPFYLSVLPKLL